MVSRRTLIAGGAGAAVVAGLGYRILDRGVFAGPGGPAYAPWERWQGRVIDGLKRPLAAAILAANPHDTQPWLFGLGNESIAVYADRARNLGAFDPFRREMHLGLGCAIENLVRAAGVHGYTPYVRPVAGPADGFAARRARHRRAYHDGPRRARPRRAVRGDPEPPHQSRRLPRHAVAPALLNDLARLADTPDIRVVFLTDAGARQALGDLIVDATTRIVADPQMSAASARWIRTGPPRHRRASRRRHHRRGRAFAAHGHARQAGARSWGPRRRIRPGSPTRAAFRSMRRCSA